MYKTFRKKQYNENKYFFKERQLCKASHLRQTHRLPFCKKMLFGCNLFCHNSVFPPSNLTPMFSSLLYFKSNAKSWFKNKKSPKLWKKSPLSGFELGTLGWLILTVTSLSNFSNLQKLTLPPFSVSYVALREARHLKPSLKHPRDLPLCPCQVWGRSDQRFRRL